MAIFSKPLVEVREVSIGDTGQIIKLSPPTAFLYREYIRRVKDVYESEGLVEQADFDEKELDEQSAMEVTQRLHRMLDGNEQVVILQLVCCTKANYPDESWDSMIKEFTSSAHSVLFEAVEPHINEFLKIEEVQEEGSDLEKKHNTLTPDSPTD